MSQPQDVLDQVADLIGAPRGDHPAILRETRRLVRLRDEQAARAAWDALSPAEQYQRRLEAAQYARYRDERT